MRGEDAAFEYDAFGRRTNKTIGTQTTSYHYDGPNIVADQTGTTETGYLTGLGVDEVFARTVGGTTATYLVDGLGSTLGLADATGAIPTKYSYGPFGNTQTSGTADLNPFQYAGRENDGTGLYYNRARYYSPQYGRFISEDPIGHAGGDNNLYSYVANSPVNGTDPSGLCGVPGVDLAVEANGLIWQLHATVSGIADTSQAQGWSPDQIYDSLQSAYSSFRTGVALLFAAHCIPFALSAAVPGAGRTPALRQAYVDDVARIGGENAAWQAAGADAEFIAGEAWANRRAIGIQYKDLTPPGLQEEIYARNRAKYGDPLGPSIEWLRSHGKTWEDIIESATRTGGRDLGF